jgi:CRISPR system Cascade subunit CasC
MSRTIIDIHILQTVPPSNLNRDDTGSPKTAMYGGVRRARVSSQAWKRAVRTAFEDVLDTSELGERTKRVGEAVAQRITAIAPELAEQATDLAATVLKAAGLLKDKVKKGADAKDAKKSEAPESEYLLFLSHQQLDNLAEEAVKAARSGVDPDPKVVKPLANQDHSVDIAMFGRMVADISDINVDAAVQVAHAISVHAVSNEFDYFTAVDDRKQDAQETGAGMIGTVEFNSSTLYRYASVDVNRLHDTLGDVEATQRAVQAFVRAFVTSMPTGKQNTFANRTLPDAVVIRMRDTQSISFVGAFEEPIRDRQDAGGRVERAAQSLAAYVTEVERTYGEQPIGAWVAHVGDRTQSLSALGKAMPLNEIVSSIGIEVAARLGQV